MTPSGVVGRSRRSLRAFALGVAAVRADAAAEPLQRVLCPYDGAEEAVFGTREALLLEERELIEQLSLNCSR